MKEVFRCRCQPVAWWENCV